MIRVDKNTPEEFVSLYVRYWQMLYVPEEYWVDGRQFEFLTHTIVLNAKGVDLGSTEYVSAVMEKMGFKSNIEVYTYRKKLTDKGLLLKSSNTYRLPQALDLKVIPKKAKFAFEVYLNEEDERPVAVPVREQPRQIVREDPVEDDVEDEDEVILPELPKEDKEANKKAYREMVDTVYKSASAIRRTGGYSDEEYQRLQAERDMRNITANTVPDAEPEEEETYNIIDLDK